MIPDWIEAIRRDNRSGAAELAARAARALAEWAPTKRREEVLAALRALIGAQPRMAPMLHLASAIWATQEDVAAACHRFLARQDRAAGAVVAYAAALIQEGDIVATHSLSSTVRAALRKAAGDGKRFSVCLTESRPVCEGVMLARDLAAAGIPVRLFVDAAAGLIASEARVVLVGADAITVDGVVNKVGTWLLALAARERAVAVYALAATDKFVPADYEMPPEPLRDPAEIMPEPASGVEVVNRYFEVTPLNLFQGLVTEEGVLDWDEVRTRLAQLRLPAELREMEGA